jgi:hypothetical protein
VKAPTNNEALALRGLRRSQGATSRAPPQVKRGRRSASWRPAGALSLTSPSGGALTNDPTPSFAGVAGTATGDDATVQVEVRDAHGAVAQTVTAQRNGATGTYAAQASSPLADGTYTAVAEQSDDVGNHHATGAVTFRIDAHAPAVALTSTPAARSNDAAPAFAGTAGTAAGDTPAVSVRIFSGPAASGTPVASFEATVDDGGRFTARAAPLPDGTYTTTITQTDSSGNASSASPATFTVDTAAPALTLTTPAAGGQAAPTAAFAGVGGTAPGDGAVVTVTVHAGDTTGGALVQTIPVTRDPANGSYSATSPFALAAGTYTVVATQADDVGNSGSTTARTFTVGAGGGGGETPGVDRVAPVLSRVSLSATRFAVTKTRTVLTAAKALKRGTTIRYTLSEVATVKLTITRAGKTKAINTLTRRSKKGANRIAFSGRIAKKALASGRYTLRLTATDAAGNRGGVKKLSFRIG